MELQPKIINKLNFKIMKQLKKLKLKDFSEMTDSEMKFVVGGSGGGSGTKDNPFQLPEVEIFPSGSGCKKTVCSSMKEGDKCSIMYEGKVYDGQCIKDQFNDGELYCSDAWN